MLCEPISRVLGKPTSGVVQKDSGRGYPALREAG